MELENTKSFEQWGKWKKTIKTAVDLGETVGLTEKTVENIGVKIGNILAAKVDPENREQRLLQELWKVGDDTDRQCLSKMIVKMVQTDNK